MFRQIATFVCSLCKYRWTAPYEPTKGVAPTACPKCHRSVGVELEVETVRSEKAPRV